MKVSVPRQMLLVSPFSNFIKSTTSSLPASPKRKKYACFAITSSELSEPKKTSQKFLEEGANFSLIIKRHSKVSLGMYDTDNHATPATLPLVCN